MICSECGSNIPEGSWFCPRCGTAAHLVRGPVDPPSRPPGPEYQKQVHVTARAGRTQPEDKLQRRHRGGHTHADHLKNLGPYKAYIAGALAGFCGFMIALSTVWRWLVQESVSAEGLLAAGTYGWSGWQLSVPPKFIAIMGFPLGQLVQAPSGNFLLRWGKGTLLFTGFWSLVIGLGIIACALLVFREKRAGGILALALGSLGFLISVVNIIMVFGPINSRFMSISNSHISANVGPGLWALLFFSICTAVIGFLCIRYPAIDAHKDKP